MNITEYNEKFNEKKIQERIIEMPENLKEKAIEAFKAEEAEDYVKARDLCKEILDENEGGNVEPVRVLLARLYPHILRIDVEDVNSNYQKDVDEYFAFLDSVNMNEIMQQYVVDTLAKMCELMENDWFRPLFKKFVDRINEKNYLTDESFVMTLESAYSSMESYEYYKDAKVSLPVKDFLKSAYQKKYFMNEDISESEKINMIIDELTNEWFICKSFEEKKKELEYICQTYPYSYACIKEVVSEIEADKNTLCEKVLIELMKYAAPGTTKEQLTDALEKSYARMMEAENKKIVIHSGTGSYKRKTSKISRNDLCPCGSGKKYKNCCGK